MLRVEAIGSFDDPRLAPYRTMKRQYDHHKEEIFVAEGEKVVRRLLESPLEVQSVLLPEKWLLDLEPLLNARSGISIFVAPKNILEQLTGFPLYQGVLAVAKIPSVASLESVLKINTPSYFFAAVDGLSNAENMGLLIRNCAAFGVQALIVGETCHSPYLRRAVRSSMGTIFKMPIVETTCLAETLRELRQRQVRCIAAHPHSDRRTIFEADFSKHCCIVFGSEGNGISTEVLEACDEAVMIPMHAAVDSLNVGSAAAVFLFEACRQRSNSVSL